MPDLYLYKIFITEHEADAFQQALDADSECCGLVDGRWVVFYSVDLEPRV